MPRAKHIAFLKFKPTTDSDTAAGVGRSVEALPGQIPGILEFSWGPNTSQEGLSQGFTHSLMMTFADASARDAYLVHPIHIAAAQKVLAAIESIAVCDHEVAVSEQAA